MGGSCQETLSLQRRRRQAIWWIRRDNLVKVNEKSKIVNSDPPNIKPEDGIEIPAEEHHRIKFKLWWLRHEQSIWPDESHGVKEPNDAAECLCKDQEDHERLCGLQPDRGRPARPSRALRQEPQGLWWRAPGEDGKKILVRETWYLAKLKDDLIPYE